METTEKEKLRREFLSGYLKTGIHTPEELNDVLQYGLGIVIPSHVMVEGHSSPFDALSEVFFETLPNQFWWANRTGGKSFNLGLLAWLEGQFKNRCSARILGAVFEQSEKSYKALKDVIEENPVLKPSIQYGPTMRRTKWRNKSDVEVLTASVKQVRGPHPQKLRLDEIEEFDPVIFEASLSQTRTAYDVKASTLMASTHHKISGIVDYVLIDLIEKRKVVKLSKWGVFEVLESCKDYVCSTCPLVNINCPGKDKMVHANGYYTIDDFVTKLGFLTRDSINSEWLCQRPSSRSIVYEEFDKYTHVGDFPFKNDVPTVYCMDFGGTAPFAFLVLQKDGDNIYIVEEVYEDKISMHRFMGYVQQRPWFKKGMTVFCDPSASSEIKELNEIYGLEAIKGIRHIELGIRTIRGLLKPVIGKPKLYINQTCRNTIREFQSHSIVKPDIENHSLDACRYGILGLIGTSGSACSYSLDDVLPEDTLLQEEDSAHTRRRFSLWR